MMQRKYDAGKTERLGKAFHRGRRRENGPVIEFRAMPEEVCWTERRTGTDATVIGFGGASGMAEVCAFIAEG